MSQGRYVWIAGKKVYLNPELQKEWDKLINKERYRARQEKICGQADYRRCNGDCFVCPWRKEGIVVSYETEHFAEGFGNDNAARGYGVVNCESTLEEKYIAEERYNTLCARIYRYADSAYPDGAKIIACYLNGETLERTASYGQGSALSPASNAEVYKRTSEYILRFLMWHYFRFRRIICLRVALHFTSVRQREKFFCRNS